MSVGHPDAPRARDSVTNKRRVMQKTPAKTSRRWSRLLWWMEVLAARPAARN